MTPAPPSFLPECRHACPWQGTSRCLRGWVSRERLLHARLGLGVVCGLKSIYGADGLPPCLHEGGYITWGPEQGSGACLPKQPAGDEMAGDW